MKRANRIRIGHVAAASGLLLVLGALVLPISSLRHHLLGDHSFAHSGLVQELHTQHRLVAEEHPLPTVSTNSYTAGRRRDASGAAAVLATVRRIQAASQELGHGGGRRNLTQEYVQEGCSRRNALLKVFMYDLPPELHFGLIDPRSVEKGQTWPADLAHVVPYPGGLTQQHSPEYWLTLDLLSSLELPNSTGASDDSQGMLEPRRQLQSKKSAAQGDTKIRRDRSCVAIRVQDAKDADVFFVPFFSSLSYNRYHNKIRAAARDESLQRRLVEYVKKQGAWRKSQGRDHVLVMHHPNSLHIAKNMLGKATFIVADFARVSSTVSHLGKDVVAPYMHVLPTFLEDDTSFETRPTLLFFQGAIQRKEGGIIRQRLYNLLGRENDVVFKDGRYSSATMKTALRGMRSSKFCLHLAGDTPSSNRLFDAIVSHCVPVIISKDIELPFEDILDYSKFCLFVSDEDALKRGFLLRFLKSIGKEEWTKMWKRLTEVHRHFEYQFPARESDATQMVWMSLAHKLPFIKQKIHRLQRFARSNQFHFDPTNV